VFERFTPPARRFVVHAQDEARDLGHDRVGTEHVLLGLLREEDGIGARVLIARGITFAKVSKRVAAIEGPGSSTGQIPFTRRAKAVVERAPDEATGLGHEWVGTEHVLLALSREGDGVAAWIVGDLGASPGILAEDVLAALGGADPG
jgi:ATP-dependent Clp protease ATP-binding subunit ClpC